MEKKSNQVQPQPLWPSQCLPSFHTTAQGEPISSVDCTMEEILAHEIDMIEPTIVTNEKETFNDILKDLRDDDFLDLELELEFGIENSYDQSIYPTTQRIQHKVEPQDVTKYGESFDKHNRKNAEELDYVGGSNNNENFGITNTRGEHKNESIQSTESESKTLNMPNDKRIHEDEKLPVREPCNKLFAREQSLKHHSRIHTDYNPHTCGICKKSFRLKMLLQRHLISHSDERPHVCAKCNKSFKRKDDLTTHIIIHTGEKPHTCCICNKSFCHISNLNSHAKIHTDVGKPHICGSCNKSFSRKRDLLAHSSIHTGTKPFVCNVCQKEFTRNSTLRLHSFSHTGQ